jgi:hypothetical protein
MNDDFFGAVTVMVIFGAPVAAWIVTRVLAHNERMEMIRRGMVPPPPGVRPMPGNDWTHPGAWSGPMPPPPPLGKRGYPPPGYDDYFHARRQLRKGLTLTFIGAALLIGLGSIGPLAHIGFAGPWLLGGLIPMFIGLAQVVSAVLGGARLPSFGAGSYPGQQTTFGPPPPQGGATPPQPPPNGPYAWRPGPTPEIERPPEQR